VFAAGRDGLHVTTLNSKYVKSATVIAATLEAKGIIPFLSSGDSEPNAFAFDGVPNAMLYIMGQKSREEALPAPTLAMYSKGTVEATIARLEEQIEVSRKNARYTKHEHFKRASLDKIARLELRIAQLRAAIAPKLEGPAPSEQSASAQPPPVASGSQLSVVH
jgi:hypothetical protein